MIVTVKISTDFGVFDDIEMDCNGYTKVQSIVDHVSTVTGVDAFWIHLFKKHNVLPPAALYKGATMAEEGITADCCIDTVREFPPPRCVFPKLYMEGFEPRYTRSGACYNPDKVDILKKK